MILGCAGKQRDVSCCALPRTYESIPSRAASFAVAGRSKGRARYQRRYTAANDVKTQVVPAFVKTGSRCSSIVDSVLRSVLTLPAEQSSVLRSGASYQIYRRGGRLGKTTSHSSLLDRRCQYRHCPHPAGARSAGHFRNPVHADRRGGKNSDFLSDLPRGGYSVFCHGDCQRRHRLG